MEPYFINKFPNSLFCSALLRPILRVLSVLCGEELRKNKLLKAC